MWNQSILLGLTGKKINDLFSISVRDKMFSLMFLNRGAVLSVVMSSTGEQCFSGGVDGTIQCWNTPNPNIDPYDSYGKRILHGAWSQKGRIN